MLSIVCFITEKSIPLKVIYAWKNFGGITTVCFMDLDRGSKINFESILSTFEASFIF